MQELNHQQKIMFDFLLLRFFFWFGLVGVEIQYGWKINTKIVAAKSWIGTKAAAKKGALRHWLLPLLPFVATTVMILMLSKEV